MTVMLMDRRKDLQIWMNAGQANKSPDVGSMVVALRSTHELSLSPEYLASIAALNGNGG